jgi:excisionase family DNA binding protein
MNNGLSDGNELLTVPETAALLRLRPSTIRAWTCQRKIPFVKLGRLVRIRRTDAEGVIAAGLVPVSAGSERARLG